MSKNKILQDRPERCVSLMKSWLPLTADELFEEINLALAMWMVKMKGQESIIKIALRDKG